MSGHDVFMLAAKRSAVVPRDGALADVDVFTLGAEVLKGLIQSAGIEPRCIDELIVGNALAGGGNPARASALAAGLDQRVAGLTIDRQCVSGADAVLLGKSLIESGQHDLVVVGGVESYSRRPLRYETFHNDGAPKFYDQPRFTPWPERDPSMNTAAANLADKLAISREEQDQWAVASHQKARDAAVALQAEILPVLDAVQKTDAYARNLTLATCNRAKSLDRTVTTANTAVAADAAAFCLLGSEKMAAQMGVNPVRISTAATVGDDPELPGLAPVPAIKKVLSNAGFQSDDLAVAEVMEAYAVQAIACIRNTGIDPEITNIEGGALARGHPIGASGAILMVRLFSLLQNRPRKFGLAVIAAAGGIGTSVIVES